MPVLIALELNNQGSGGNVGWSQSGPFRTLGTGGPPGIAQTITAKMYDSGGATAGNNPGVRNVFAFSCKDHGGDFSEVSPTLRSMNNDAGNVNGGGQVAVGAASGVRRLTPIETERLQGFPDGWTAIQWKRRRIAADEAAYYQRHGLECWQDGERWLTRVAADTPRYHAIGNSMAVPVLRYLLDRIRKVNAWQISMTR